MHVQNLLMIILGFIGEGMIPLLVVDQSLRDIFLNILPYIWDIIRDISIPTTSQPHNYTLNPTLRVDKMYEDL